MLQLREHKKKNIAGIFFREPHIKLKNRKKIIIFCFFSNFSFVLPLTMHIFIQGSNKKMIIEESMLQKSIHPE